MASFFQREKGERSDTKYKGHLRCIYPRDRKNALVFDWTENGAINFLEEWHPNPNWLSQGQHFQKDWMNFLQVENNFDKGQEKNLKPSQELTSCGKEVAQKFQTDVSIRAGIDLLWRRANVLNISV